MVLADDRADEVLRDEILVEWESQSACCLTPGIARMMKLVGVIAEELLLPQWQTMLYWIAFALKLSVADIETRHPRNKNSCAPNGCSSWSTIVSNYVCAEHTALTRAQVQTLLNRQGRLGQQMPARPAVTEPAEHGEAAEPAEHGEAAETAEPDTPAAALAEPEPKKQRLKGMGPLRLYQLDRESVIPRGKGGKWTTLGWAQLRDEFEALPPERKAHYEQRSIATCTQAKAARDERDARIETALEAGDATSSAMVAVATPTTAMLALLSPAGQPTLPTPVNLIQPYRWEPMQAGSPCRPSASALNDSAYAAFQHYHCLTAGDEDAAQLSYLNPDNLRQFYRNRGVKKIAEQFVRDSRRLSGPRAFEFPAEVEYPSCCVGLCRNETPECVLAMQDALVSILAAVASQAVESPATAAAKKPNRNYSDLPMTDTLLIFSSVCDRSVEISLWWMIIASGRNGNILPTETFMKIIPPPGFSVASIGEGDVAMRIERGAAVAPEEEQRRPFDEQAATPVFYTEIGVAKSAVCPGEHIATEVIVEKALFRDSLHGVIVTGKDPDFAPVRAEEGAVLAAAAAARAARAPAAAAAPAPAPVAPDGVFDFMQLLDEDFHDEEAAAAAPAPEPADGSGGLDFDDDDDLLGWAKALFGPETFLDACDAIDMLREAEDEEAEQAGAAAEAAESGGDEAAAAADVADVSDHEGDVEEVSIYTARAGESTAGEHHTGLLPPGPAADPSPIPAIPTAGGSAAASSSDAPAMPIVPPPPPLLEHGLDLPEWVEYKVTGAKSGIFANVFEAKAGVRHRIGVMHHTRPGAFQMTCKAHKKCQVWLTLYGKSEKDGQQSLCEWLMAASENSEGVGEDEHWRRGIALKRSYGMKV